MRWAYLTILILAVLGVACQPSSQVAPQELRVNIRDEPQTLDPRKARLLGNVALLRLLFDGLTRINKEGKVDLALAESVKTSPDLKQYTFRLRSAFWSNGVPVLASDFVYAWKKVLSPQFPSDMAFLLYGIKNAKAAKEGKVSVDAIGVRAPDVKTLVVELENPLPYFLELLGSPVFFPVCQKADEQNPNWAQNASSYVSNGPFRLTSWRHHDQLELKKNKSYWDASNVKLTSLKFPMVAEEAELMMFEKQELDWAGSPLSALSVNALKSLKENSPLKTQTALDTYFIRTNTEFTPFKHSAIRKAFALAINRKAIVEHVTQGYQEPATGLVPPSFGLQKEPYFTDGDVVEAERLFAEGLSALHLSKEQLPEICFLYRRTERNHLIAQALQQQWYDAFGIQVRLEGLEAKVFVNRVSKQDYHLAYGDWAADFADPINFLEVFKYKKGGSNNTLWENSQYAHLLDLSSQTSDVKQRNELLAESERILIEEMPIIPVLYSNMLYLSQPGLKDVVLSPMGFVDFKWASIDRSSDQERSVR